MGMSCRCRMCLDLWCPVSGVEVILLTQPGIVLVQHVVSWANLTAQNHNLIIALLYTACDGETHEVCIHQNQARIVSNSVQYIHRCTV